MEPSSPRFLRRWDLAWIVVALAVLAWVFYRTTMLNSHVVDGRRWFVIDDDMMISMRYARNLAEGHGLVWNIGEHVEGYTNFLWTMVMAVVHLFGASDRTAAVWVRVCSFGFLAGALVQGLRLVRVFAPRSLAAAPVFLAVTVVTYDVTVWAAWGYETALMAFLVLTFLVSVFKDPTGIWGWVALALLPLTRADAMYLFVASAVVAYVVADDRKACIRRLGLAALPFIAYLVFRRVYYGEWLPNTYYLKRYKLDGAYRRGWTYAWGFVRQYPIQLLLAGAAAGVLLARRDRRAAAFFVLVGGTFAYVVVASGGDSLLRYRFFAPILPLVLVFATVGVVQLVAHGPARVIWVTVLLVFSIQVTRPFTRLIAVDTNGDPHEQIQVAMLMKKNARPESSVAVLAAGIVPYFTRLRAIDVLGKSDKHVARLDPYPGAMVGHGKLDPAYTLGDQRPDLVVSYRSEAFADGLTPAMRTADPVRRFLASGPFRSSYLPLPIEDDFLQQTTAVYTHEGSPEAANREWKPIR